jgi:hypothetical protein
LISCWYRIASLNELQISLGQPQFMGGLGGWVGGFGGETWRTTGRQESWIRILADSDFWPIHLAIWADWYTRRYKYMKIFQDCAKLKLSTHCLRGIVLWRPLPEDCVSIPDVCKGNGVIWFFQFLSHSIRDDLISNKWAPQLSKSTLY